MTDLNTHQVLDILPDRQEFVIHNGVPLLPFLVCVHVGLQVPHKLVSNLDHEVRTQEEEDIKGHEDGVTRLLLPEMDLIYSWT